MIERDFQGSALDPLGPGAPDPINEIVKGKPFTGVQGAKPLASFP